MRFSVAALATLAAGAAATEYTTEVVTHYETYCPSSAAAMTPSSLPVSVPSSSSLAMSSIPVSSIPVSSGAPSYTVTRPLLTSTVTYCNNCAGPTAPVGSYTPSVKPSVNPVYSNSTAIVVAPSSTGAATLAPTNAPSGTTPASPVFTGGASRMTGAGAGLATLFGLVAFLL